MKTVTLVLFASLLSCSYLHAQTAKGNMMVGGTLSLSTQTPENDNDNKLSTTTFSPSFGYFVMDNLAVGANLEIFNRTSKTPTSKEVQSAIGFGPFARYYKFTSNENFAFFAQAQLLFVSGKDKVTAINTPTATSKNSRTSFSISPGFSYFLTKHWALDLSITGLVVRSEDPDKEDDDDKYTTIVFGLSSLSPNIGLRYHFGN
jgi:opacity protein-like surface antigen